MAILDLLQTAEDPKYPGLVLSLHVIAKNVEMGSLLGLALGVLGGSVDVVRRRPRPLSKILKTCEFGVCLGALAGIASITYRAAFNPTMDHDGITDRAYRLVHSKPGIKQDMDVQFLLGGVIGALLVGFAVPVSWVDMDLADRLARGYCLGAAVAAAPLTIKVGMKMARKQLQML